MADAVLSVEVRAKLEALSKGLGTAEKSIADFVNKGDRHISVIERRFAQMGKSTKEISENIKASFGGMSLDKYFQTFGNSKEVIASAKAEVAKYKAELEKLKATGQEITNQIKAKNAALSDSKNATEQARTATEAQRRATEAERTENMRLRNELQALRNEKARNNQATTAAAGSYREAQQRLTALGRTIRESAGGFDSKNKVIRAQITEYNKLNQKLKEFDARMGNHQRNVGNYTSALAGSIPILGQYASAAGMASLAAAGLRQSFQTNLKFDAIEYALERVSGSTENFGKNMVFLRNMANRLGLDLYTSMAAFRQWEGAVQHSNLTADQSREIFESVANAGAKMKLTTDQIQGTFLALSQMMSKGVVSMEELRRQLGDRLPSAFAIASRAMGLSQAEMNKLVASGKLMSEDFLPKFAKELDKAFGNDKISKIESMQASVERLGNEWDGLWRSDAATSFFQAISDGSANALRGLNKLMNSPSWRDMARLSISGMFTPLAQVNTIRKMGKREMDSEFTGTAHEDALKVFDVMNGVNTYLQRNAREYSVFTSKVDDNSNAVKRNKEYWDDTLKSLKTKFESLDVSEVGSAQWKKLNAQIKEAQENVNLYSSSKQDSALKRSTAETARLLKEAERLEKARLDILKRSDNDVKKIQMSATEWEIEQLNQKYEEYKKTVGDHHDALKRLEENYNVELNAIKLNALKKEIEDRKKLDKEIQDQVDKQRKEHAQSISVDLVFDRRFNETAGQRSLRMLNDKYKKLAEDAEAKIQELMMKDGGLNLDGGLAKAERERNHLQEEYFQKVEEIYKQDQKTQLAMVDTRNVFNKSLEATNILLDENARKMQAGAISPEQFQANQEALLQNKDMLGALANAYDQLASGVGNAFASMLTEGKSFGEGMEQVFKSMVSSILSEMARLAAVRFLGALFTGGASLAIPGFATGGYTGNIGRNKVAGLVHGQEFVFDAAATKRIGVDNLKALHTGNIPKVSDLTPRISKSFSNFIPSANKVSSRQTLSIHVDGSIRNNEIHLSNKKAVRNEKKFGRGR